MKRTLAVFIISLACWQIQARPPGSVFFYEDNSFSEESSFSLESDSMEAIKEDCINEVQMSNETLQRLDQYPSEQLTPEDAIKLDEFYICLMGTIGYIDQSSELEFDGIATRYFDLPDYSEVVSDDVYNNITAAVEKCRNSVSQNSFMQCVKDEMGEERQEQRKEGHDYDDDDEDSSSEESERSMLITNECINEVNLDNETIQRSRAQEWEELATEDCIKLDEYYLCYIGKLGFVKPNGEIDFDGIAAANYESDGGSRTNIAAGIAAKKCRSNISQETYMFTKIRKFMDCVEHELE